jgi:hypothetical protein
MTILADNIKHINRIEKHDIDHVSVWLFDAVKISVKDNKQSVERKIELLKFLLDYLPHAINIESLSSDDEQLTFIKLLSKLTDIKEELEILIGKRTQAELEEIGINFSQKTQSPIGFTE